MTFKSECIAIPILVVFGTVSDIRHISSTRITCDRQYLTTDSDYKSSLFVPHYTAPGTELLSLSRMSKLVDFCLPWFLRGLLARGWDSVLYDGEVCCNRWEWCLKYWVLIEVVGSCEALLSTASLRQTSTGLFSNRYVAVTEWQRWYAWRRLHDGRLAL